MTSKLYESFLKGLIANRSIGFYTIKKGRINLKMLKDILIINKAFYVQSL